jgi:hypothetical protein
MFLLGDFVTISLVREGEMLEVMLRMGAMSYSNEQVESLRGLAFPQQVFERIKQEKVLKFFRYVS